MKRFLSLRSLIILVPLVLLIGVPFATFAKSPAQAQHTTGKSSSSAIDATVVCHVPFTHDTCYTDIWAGYAVHDTTFNTVRGTWLVPSVTCSSGETSAVGVWVGLGGIQMFGGGAHLEQLGTLSGCDKGTPVYFPWFETPGAPRSEFVNIQDLIPTNVIKPGDNVTGEVDFVDTNEYVFTLFNNTQKWRFIHFERINGTVRSSAEWIVEAPSVCNSSTDRLVIHTTPFKSSFVRCKLSKFGTPVQFTNCTANGKTILQAPAHTKFILTNRGFAPIPFISPKLADTSDIGSDGKSFHVTWLRAGTQGA